MNIPLTLLSLIYHGTVPNYRDEIHHNVDQAFERFKITDQGFAGLQGPGMPTAAQVREVGKRVELAAFKIRKNAAQAKQEMHKKTTDLFNLLAPLLAAEIEGGVQSPPQGPTGSGSPHESLLSQLYLLVYSPQFRAEPEKHPVFEDAALTQSWDALLAALNAGGGAPGALGAHTQKLCTELSKRFETTIFQHVW